MRVFVSEYISSGALSGRPLSGSMLREGHAMLLAVIADLLRSPGVNVTTTLDDRLPPLANPELSLARVETADEEQTAFDRFVPSSDVTLVIAPETGGVLAQRVWRVHELGGQTANCSPESISLCGDKWRLAQHLEAHDIRTIPTQIADLKIEDPWKQFDSACVLKPRDGAGSWLTFHIPRGDRDAWQTATQEFRRARIADHVLLQPFIPGQSISVSSLCHSTGELDVFPIGLQHVDSKTLQYQGGSIPASIPDETKDIIENLIRKTCSTIPGLRGYIGFDLILPDAEARCPVITEINPRLTTSYVGYRQLCHDNLAERLLESTIGFAGSQSYSAPLRWNQAVIRFDADGVCSHEFEFD